MKKNQAHKTKKQSLAEDKKKSGAFYNSGFEHITGKHICLKCNTVKNHGFKCCGIESYCLGKIARTPKSTASRSKWKAFYKHMTWWFKNFDKHPEFANIVKKYNIEIKKYEASA